MSNFFDTALNIAYLPVAMWSLAVALNAALLANYIMFMLSLYFTEKKETAE